MIDTTTKRRRRGFRHLWIYLFVILATLSPVGDSLAFEAWDWGFRDQPSEPFLLPEMTGFPIELVLDDGQAEGAFGVTGGGNARQFLFFNLFDLQGLGDIQIEELWAFFPPGPNMAVGAAVELVVLHDPDGDPSNGADLLASYDETIQTLDGASFSVYPLASPLTLPRDGYLLVGVVPRFIVSGITSPTNPAAIDTSTLSQQSWLAVWTGDPPSPISLPSDQFIGVIDLILPGTWTLRAYGTRRPIVEVPTLGAAGLALLVVALALVAAAVLRKQRHSAS